MFATWDDIGHPEACNAMDDSVYMPAYYNIGDKFPAIPVKVPFGWCMPSICKHDNLLKDILSFINTFMDTGVTTL
jgi:hypothetical protein